MSNIKRVTIVLSKSMTESMKAAIERGAFVAANDDFHRAARLWCAVAERRSPAIEAPSIAGDEPTDPSRALQYSR
jgi:Arc/MetJ-type ribon-helix-helix transcriptional regulator